MVEVLEHGDKMIVNCTLCGAKLKYSKLDIKEEEVFETQRFSYFRKYITCPDCEEKITIDKNTKR